MNFICLFWDEGVAHAVLELPPQTQAIHLPTSGSWVLGFPACIAVSSRKLFPYLKTWHHHLSRFFWLLDMVFSYSILTEIYLFALRCEVSWNNVYIGEDYIFEAEGTLCSLKAVTSCRPGRSILASVLCLLLCSRSICKKISFIMAHAYWITYSSFKLWSSKSFENVCP